jgi:hypothetical protein
MKSLLLLLVFPASGFAAVAPVAPTASPAAPPLIIVPGAPMQPTAPVILTPGQIVAPATQPLIIPQAPVILAPGPLITPASRPLSEAEASAKTLPSQEELKNLAEGLSGREDTEPDERAAGGAFDGSAAEPTAPLDVSYFGLGPLAPDLSEVESAARAVMGHFLPRFYRPIPAASAYAKDKITGHTWTPANGHLIEIAPTEADSSGEVPSAFGLPGALRVQQKIERFMEYSHELAHVLLDEAVRPSIHSLRSAYSALTEGFAVALEQILIERMLSQPASLRLSPRDAIDLAAIARARAQWLAVEDTQYSEGIISWRRAYERGGEVGMLTLLSSLSGRRMADTRRSDPLYQLTLGDPTLLSAYLGKNWDGRREFDAVTVESAGPEGWRRLFERTLLADKNLAEPVAVAASSKEWWKKDELKAPVSVESAFAAARVSPRAAAALTQFLLEVIQAPGGAKRLFVAPGLSPKLNAIAAGAEALPWEEAAHRAWTQALTNWLSLT